MDNRKFDQSGQTLIETLVAAFVLTMGISAALGLATYSLRATTDIQQRIVALGLAREGIEAVKNMRDTNWLQDTMSHTCYNFATDKQDMNCYKRWLKPLATSGGYNLNTGGKITTFILATDANNSRYWSLIPTESGYGLNYSTQDLTKGFYQPNVDITVCTDETCPVANGALNRAITITPESDFSPFDRDLGPRLKITSEVWWVNPKCPATAGIPSNNRCKVTLETYLTNWKTF